MYPLETVLVARDDSVLQQLRRELARNGAMVLAEFPDVSAALSELDTAEDQRRLFLVHIRGPDDLRPLQSLTQAHPTSPVAALVEEPHDFPASMDYAAAASAGHSAVGRATLFVRAMRAGALQVVTLPIDADDFRCALESIATRFGQPIDTTLIAVTGVQGGCGSTTVALNLAHTLAESTGRRCILAELAPRMGMLASYLDIKPEYTLHDLLESPHFDAQAVKTALYPFSKRLSVLCGPYRELVIPEPGRVQTAETLSLIEHLSRLAPIVVLDVPCDCDAQFFEVLYRADKLLLVCEQTLPSIHSLNLIERALLPSDRQMRTVVVNRYDPHIKVLSADELKRLVRTSSIWRLSQDPILVKAANEGRPVRTVAPRSKTAAEFEEFARSLVKGPQAGRGSSFWNWLTGHHEAAVAAKGG